MIYLVEDDHSIRELVIYTLNNSGLAAEGFEKPSLFWKACEKQIPSLIILDIMLPEEDGIEVLKKLRVSSATKKVPIMMLTAKDSEYDKVVGLDSGADDYVAKPFGMMEFLSRVKALLRRAEADHTDDEYVIGGLQVNITRHEVKADGEPVILTLKEFELLCLLFKNQGKVLSRTQLLDQIWGYSFDGENRTVDVHVRTLRQKLGKCGDYIETVRGFGYKMGGENL